MENTEYHVKILDQLTELVRINQEMSNDLKELVVQQEMIIQTIAKTNRRLDKLMDIEKEG